MSRMSRQFTTRRTVLGLPVGKPHTDWAEIRKVGMVGAGAVSTVAGGIRAWGVLPPVVKRLPGRLWGRASALVGGVGDTVARPGRGLSREQGGDRRDRQETPARTATRRPAGASGSARSSRKRSPRSAPKASSSPGARARRDGASGKSGATRKTGAARKSGASGKAGTARKAAGARRAPASRGR